MNTILSTRCFNIFLYLIYLSNILLYNCAKSDCFISRQSGFFFLNTLLKMGTTSNKVEPYFIVVQLLSRVWLFVIPWVAAWQTPLSSTVSLSLRKHMSIESVMLLIFVLGMGTTYVSLLNQELPWVWVLLLLWLLSEHQILSGELQLPSPSWRLFLSH